MADGDETLIVPVNVDALVVNEKLRGLDGRGFRRWQPDFNLLRHNRTPEPDPFTNDDAWNAEPDKRDGVYVRWELPEALRKGSAGRDGTGFALVPNRWLVVRQVDGHDKLLTGWVVESDFLDADQGTSPFIHPVRKGTGDPSAGPHRATVIPTRIGRAVRIGHDGEGWQERSSGGPAHDDLFLTAVGPGLMTFHVYQPYHENVFSLHDPLDGVPVTATLNYQVVGWYSDPVQEELNQRLRIQGATVEAVLAGLGWTASGATGDWKPGRTAYCGRAVGVAWNRDELPADWDRPDKDAVKDRIAVGSSADEAHAALIAAGRAALPDASGNAVGHTDPALLHALGRGLLDTLDGPDGPVATAQALHKGWFQQLPGGYVWRLADPSDQGNPSGDPASVTWSGAAAEQERCLAQLNQDQDAYDRAVRELASLQKRLYALWWMHGLPLIPRQYRREQFRAEIDPDNTSGLAAEVAKRQEALKGLLDRIPHGADQQELDRSVAAYKDRHPELAGHELRREALPPFHHVNDPTVVLAGSKGHTPHATPSGTGPLVCRTPAQILGGVEPGGGLPAPFDTLKAAGLPAVVPALLGEFTWLLDPAHASSLPQGLVPRSWRQPWKPLLFQWRVTHWNVPYRDRGTGTANWEFDGSHYRWRDGTPDTPLHVTGRRFLVPLPQHTMGGGLERHAAGHPDAAREAFAEAAAQVKDLDLLSQSLDGLTDAFACRNPTPNLSPPGRIGELVGDARGHLPEAGPLPVPFQGWLPSGFTQIRAGQFALSALSVVDEFGQTLDVLLEGDAGFLMPKLGDSLRPNGRYAATDLPERFVQLPPRLLQPARLRFDFVHESAPDELVDLHAGTTPVCAWIIPNYVDRSLLCYAPTGAPLGELRLALREDEATGTLSTVVAWGPLPDSQVHTIDQLSADRPQLHAFVKELAAKGPDAFADLMATVDRCLAGIDPGNPYGDEVLGALLGRPLALVRARLGFELDGPPVSDPGWQHALDWRTPAEWDAGKPVPEEMEYLTYRWPVRLGNAGQQGDGLVGYFSEDDYTTFYAVAEPGTEHPTGYVAPISGDNWPALKADSHDRTHLTLLLDPQAAVHATTDVLPVTDLRLPSRFTRTAMAAMKVALRLSPVLTTARKVPVKDEQGTTTFVNSLALPHPTSPQGTWDWSELVVPDAPEGAASAPQWNHQAVVQIDQTARLDEDGPVVRTGFLRLTDGLDGS
ncbi:hypothetical protein I5Q34_26155 [Streptomyces sp. AV19]|uniref:hypothetical protein n=1 Tax=Streptomyces sp. AV19 TaxID=2793068 RepID=UPI0018FECAC0|nr:hypothetical protein [Streptomyces sp. AV19]MBH1937713.1 hypothetical protein [Streptomyces sp. AV19]MDG4536381.1 hypothetical protein [Streptomyces sp. AV19]